MKDTSPSGRAAQRWRTTLPLATTLLALAALLVGAGVASAAIYDDDATPCWSFSIAGTEAGPDAAHDVVKTSTATWVVGEVWDGFDTRLDASLVRIPTGSAAAPTVHTWNSSANDDDYNSDVAARSTYVYSVGATRNANDTPNLDLIVIRWSSTTGAFKWVKRYAGVAKMDDAATDVVIDGAGNAVVCGSTENADGAAAWVVLKYSPSGTQLWARTFDGSAVKSERPAELYVDGAGNIYVTGYSLATTVMSAHTVKLSPAGKTLWSKKYKGPDGGYSVATAIARCPSGGVYIGGYTSTTAGGIDAFVRRYAADGTAKSYDLWDGTADDTTPQTLADIAVASNGGIVGVGRQNDEDPLRLAWRPDGTIEWYTLNITPGNDGWRAVGADAYGGVYVTGPLDNASVNPNIRTQRFSVLAGGGGWLYDDDVNAYAREVEALSVSGLSCAVTGRQYNGSDYDQYVHIWAY
jgi:hypothetical protein